MFFWLCVFLRDQQHATHPAAGKLYTCLMITHMYDEKDDLDMFNVFFDEPVLCPVGVGAGYLSIRLMQVLKPVQSFR